MSRDSISITHDYIFILGSLRGEKKRENKEKNVLVYRMIEKLDKDNFFLFYY